MTSSHTSLLICIYIDDIVPPGERRRCSEVDALGGGGDLEEGDDSSGRRTSRRRAAKNLATNVYTLDRDDVEFVDSPASSSRDVPMATSSASVRGRPVRRGRKKQGKSEPKVPPMKIKMIGRSGDNDSPIFFAESMDVSCVRVSCDCHVTCHVTCSGRKVLLLLSCFVCGVPSKGKAPEWTLRLAPYSWVTMT